MTIERTPQNLAREVFERRALPKIQPKVQPKVIPKVQPKGLRSSRAPKKPSRPEGFPAKVKAIVESRSGGGCELDQCGRADVYHHRRPRGLGGSSLSWVNRPANALHVADACHLRIEANRTRSYVNGWLVSLHGDKMSTDVPVLYRGQWVLLRDDGSVKPLDGDCWDESEVLA